MLTRDEAQTLAKKILDRVDSEQAEVIISDTRCDSTRFSGNVITQNVGLNDRAVRLRVINGKRQGVARVNQFDDATIDRLIKSALAVCSVAQEDATLLPMISEQPEYRTTDAFRESTANQSPIQRAEAVGGVLKSFDDSDLEGAGIYDAKVGAVVYANNQGVFAYQPSTSATFNVSAFAENGEVEGWAESFSLDSDRIDATTAGERAKQKALDGRNPRVIDPGAYAIIAEPAAVSEMLLFLGWLSCNGLDFAEKRSFHQGELGQKLLSDNFTLREDPFHPELGGTPFDMEGDATKALTLIENGTFKAVCHDRRTAALVGGESTGHANAQPSAGGPGPGNLVLETGDSSVDDMIASTERGLLLTKLHYTNVVERMNISITGMTRAGTFLIEDGKIVAAVKNMRFTQSLLTAFADVQAIGSEAHASGGALFGGNFVVPALKLGSFQFSSPTGF